MGCGSSSTIKFTQAHKDEVLLRYNSVRLALGLTEEECWGCYQGFVKMNKSESGSVSMDEMMEFLDFDGGPFSQRAFQIYKDTPKGISERRLCCPPASAACTVLIARLHTYFVDCRFQELHDCYLEHLHSR